MKTVFLVLAIVITLGAVVPYIRDIIRGTTKPNIVSWMTWSLLTAIAATAQLASHEYVAALFSGVATLGTAMIVILGLRYGYATYTKFDGICQTSAIFGIILWQIFDSALIGVLGAVLIDFIGGVPTLRHAWQKPWEETWVSFALGSFGGSLELLALDNYNWITLPYTVYILIFNAILATVIIVRMRRLTLSAVRVSAE